MATIKEFARALRGVIRVEMLMADNAVRPANQDMAIGPADLSFATVHVTVQDVGSTSKPDRTYYDNNEPALTVTEDLQEMQTLNASVNFYRTDALLLAHKLRMRLHSEAMTGRLNAAALGFVSASPVRDLTALEGQAYEERAQFDIQLHCIAQQLNNLTTIGSVPVSYLQDMPNRTTVHNPEIQAP